MKGLKAFLTVLTLLVHLPLWYGLVYKILETIQASELMWFLFWIYLPVGILGSILQQIVRLGEDG